MKKLSLAILINERVVESALLSENERCWKKIIPSRRPDIEIEDESLWLIPNDRRRVLGSHANKVLETYSQALCNKEVDFKERADAVMEELCGFFSISGIGMRWVDDVTARWVLFLGNKLLQLGMQLQGSRS